MIPHNTVPSILFPLLPSASTLTASTSTRWKFYNRVTKNTEIRWRAWDCGLRTAQGCRTRQLYVGFGILS